MTIAIMIAAIVIGSGLSLTGGMILLGVRKYREIALILTMPFGAGALLAAAYFDLLPEAFEQISIDSALMYCLVGFIVFFLLERMAGWFHHHHSHSHDKHDKNVSQRRLIVVGDVMHNAIDGLAIGASFLVSVPLGIITTLAVSSHEIPKELGTFAMLMSKGWHNKKVVLANVLSAIATLVSAIGIYLLGDATTGIVGPLLALTAGFFIYVAASDIIPDIHEQPRKTGTVQAAALVAGVVIVGIVIELLGV
ncbi:MAG: ZIP family metal transporter [bacterium]|nr:ZIP family metal transporter [bacterium]MDN5835179.1 ZIP family metal transporter [bacterium]